MTENLSPASAGVKSALILGGGGLLGRAMAARLAQSGWRVTALSHKECDITNEGEVERAFAQAAPSVAINCAATGDVDRCEREPDWAYEVNERGPRLLARASRTAGADLVHVSTDYVFNGYKEGFYTQEDEPDPQSVYGRSKLAGEMAVREEAERFFIIRTSWIFGIGGKNFGSRVIEYARNGARLKVIYDQTSIPTYAPDLARRIEEIIEIGAHGLFQVTNTGPASWYDFSCLALDLAGLGDYRLERVKRADLKQAAARPQNSAMRCLVSEHLGLEPLRHWREAIVDFVRDYEQRPAPSGAS